MPPFTRFKYSNLGMGLVGHVLARTAKMPWSDYMRRKILQPLGMIETGFMSEKPPAKMSLGYVPAAPGVWQAAARSMTDNKLNEAAGSIRSTAADMAKFAAWQLDDKDRRVLSAVSRREMRAPLWMDEDWSTGYGVAWVLVRKNGDVIAEHAGGTFGFSAVLCIDNRLGIAIVVLSNGIADVPGLAHRLLAPLQMAAQMESAAATTAPRPLPQSAANFSGIYVHDYAMLPPVTVAVENGALAMRDFVWGTIKLLPTDTPRRFVVPPGSPLDGEVVAFEGEDAGMQLSIGHGSIVYQRGSHPQPLPAQIGDHPHPDARRLRHKGEVQGLSLARPAPGSNVRFRLKLTFARTAAGIAARSHPAPPPHPPTTSGMVGILRTQL